MIIEKRNAVSPSLFKRIKNRIESPDFTWHYSASSSYTVTNNYDTIYGGSFSHIVCREGKKYSDISDYLECCLLSILDNLKIDIIKLHRIRVGFLTVSPENKINPPHVDFISPHSVGLLYLNDSDGDTFIYNECLDNSNPSFYNMTEGEDPSLFYFEKILHKNVTVKYRVSPEENKFVMFNGFHYHSSSTPVLTKRRLVVNYVFESNER